MEQRTVKIEVTVLLQRSPKHDEIYKQMGSDDPAWMVMDVDDGRVPSLYEIVPESELESF